MTIVDIIDDLAFAKQSQFPRAAVREAVAQKDAIIPHLLEALDQAFADYQQGELETDGDWLMPNFAAYLLASFGETQAHTRLIQLFSMDEESLDWLWADELAQDGGRMLLSTYPGDPSALQKLIEDEEASDYARSQALSAMHGAVVLSLLKEEVLVGYLSSLFRGRIERVPSFLWICMVNMAADLKLAHLESDVVKAYEEELCDEWVMRRKDVLILLHGGTLPDYKPEIPDLIVDAEREISRWPYFTEPQRVLPIKLKIGRNDPCTCGSGKKYKKCCGVGA